MEGESNHFLILNLVFKIDEMQMSYFSFALAPAGG